MRNHTAHPQQATSQHNAATAAAAEAAAAAARLNQGLKHSCLECAMIGVTSFWDCFTVLNEDDALDATWLQMSYWVMSRWLTQSELRRKKMLDYLKVAANISSLTVFSQQLDLVENLFQNEIWLFTGPPQTFWLRLCKRMFSDNVVYQLEMNKKISLVRSERNSWKAETTLRYSNRYPRTLDLVFYSSKLRTRKNLQLFKCKWH